MQPTLKFIYINWKGEIGIREITNPKFWFGNTEYHKVAQWLLKGYDINKKAERNFAVKDIIKFL